MSVRLREHKGAVPAVAVGVAALTVHLLAGRLAILTASRWTGGIAIGLAVAFVAALHLEGLRRLVARRGRAWNATSQHDDAVEQHHGQAQHDQAHDHPHPEHGRGHRHAHQDGGGLRGALAGVFRPHTHDAGDRIDSALAASAAGMRALKISLAGLGATAVIQFLVVLASGSVALLADTIHNIADALTAIPIGIAFIAGRRLANRRYTYGYGRGEDIAGLFVLLTMTASALLAAYEAVDRLVNPRELRNVGWVAAAGLIGFIGNELVATYRIRVGRRIGSAALVADGLHARTDGLTSLAVVVGAAGVAAGWRPADPIVGLVISVAIFGVLRQAAREVYGRMMDRVDDQAVLAAEQAVRQVPGVVSLDRLRMRWVGHELLAEVEISADASLLLPQAHGIAEAVRHRLLHQVRRLADATIHVSPQPSAAINPHRDTSHHFTRTA